MAKTLDTTFTSFKEWIMPLFAQTFAQRNSTIINANAFEHLGDKMLDEYEYSDAREKFLTQQTIFYIRTCLDRNESHNISTDFLEKLTNKIAAYFSYYVMNKYPIPENGKSKNKLRMRVQGELKKTLFDDNPYILYLKEKQVQNRTFRSKTKSERKKSVRAKHIDAANEAYRQARQVRSLFTDAQNTPRKKR